MIIVTSSSKRFTYGIKGLPRRVPALNDYREEIDALYAAVEQSAQSDIPGPTIWDAENVKLFLRAVVERVLRKHLPDDADMFRNGCDR